MEEQDKMGVRIVLVPTIAATAGLQAAWEQLNELKAHGLQAQNDWNARADRNPWGRPGRGNLLGNVRDIESRFLPQSLRRDYDSTWGHRTNYAETPAKKKATAKRR
jgi:hypothetical protein